MQQSYINVIENAVALVLDAQDKWINSTFGKIEILLLRYPWVFTSCLPYA